MPESARSAAAAAEPPVSACGPIGQARAGRGMNTGECSTNIHTQHTCTTALTIHSVPNLLKSARPRRPKPDAAPIYAHTEGLSRLCGARHWLSACAVSRCASQQIEDAHPTRHQPPVPAHIRCHTMSVISCRTYPVPRRPPPCVCCCCCYQLP